MRVLVVADEDFATRERAMLSRLEVGLADEGVRIVHALPTAAAKAHHPEVFSQSVTYSPGRPASSHWRAKWLKEAVEQLGEGEPTPVDIVHCFGEGSWDIGAEVAAQTQAGLVLEVWGSSLVPGAVRVIADAEPGSALALTPDPAVTRLLQAEDPAFPARTAAWGVHTPGAPLDVLQADRSISIVLVAEGRDAAAIRASLEGLARVMSEHPEVMVFAEEPAIQRAAAWKNVKQLGIADRFTLAPDLESRRELALRSDVLMLPEARGDARTITLDAMAAGMIVVAASDPMVGVLQEGRTARLVDGARPERWAEMLGWVFRERDAARALGLAAREHVRQHFRASAQVSTVVDAYEWMRSGESIPFQPGA